MLLLAPALASADENHHKKHAPSEAAIAACQERAQGDACKFTGRRGEVEGVCRVHHQQNVLFCKRPHAPRQHQQ